jgi:hypothetical protein
VSKERDRQMWRSAGMLARSGKYRSWWVIQIELRAQGYSRARELMDDKLAQRRLDQLCGEAQAHRAAGREK